MPVLRGVPRWIQPDCCDASTEKMVLRHAERGNCTSLSWAAGASACMVESPLQTCNQSGHYRDRFCCDGFMRVPNGLHLSAFARPVPGTEDVGQALLLEGTFSCAPPRFLYAFLH